jgi:cellulose synthase/poly-beta-1,6-N-acetylglucosamine synthase-like glycosyltransferase
MGSNAPRVDGKFLAVENHRFLVRGVAYGTFAPTGNGDQFPPPARVTQDFLQMAAAGINTIRTYTVPPRELLDIAQECGLKVMVGLPWPQHIPFLDDPHVVRQIRNDATAAVRRLESHAATLMFAVGNEIPAGVVRWHGHRRIERFLRELYGDVKTAAPESIFTYVNFPPTEHLDLECFDVCAFNVYLHREAELRGYLARLQHIAGARPLLLSEAGADSVREGLEGQSRITTMQLRAAFAEGACGAIVYSWTDEWWRGGRRVDDWAFGLVDEARRPKPAMAAVKEAFAEAPISFPEARQWPKVSVVVCAYNAADTIDDCLGALARLAYPPSPKGYGEADSSFEVIVVNDGSRDTTSSIARRYPGVKVIDTPNGGLSAARNVGLAAATGEIVAYTDADARVDPDWLTYLIQPMLASDVVGAGGPNLVPPDDPWIAQCVARAPGGPSHVMLDDRIAEHVPGCNMAFRRDALLSIDGFNPVYLRAGDDVDICWRLQSRGFRIAFAPAALVWHHHRPTVKAYWQQQIGYGEGEAWLDAHHPEKFVGRQMLWHGRIYSPLPFLRSALGKRVNTGVWGTAAFPSIYSIPTAPWQFLPHSPLWLIASFLLLVAGVAGSVLEIGTWWILFIAGALGWAITIVRCVTFAWRTNLIGLPPIGPCSPRQSRHLYRAMIAWLHLVQPVARFLGNVQGLSLSRGVASQHVTRLPWKTRVPTLRDAWAAARLLTGGGSERSFWAESWTSQSTLLTELVGILRACRPAQLVRLDEGWHPDRDLSIAMGRWGWLHVRTLVEEHERGCCLFRVRACLRPSFTGTLHGLALAVLLAGATGVSIAFYRPSASIVASILAIVMLAVRAMWQATRAAAVLDQAVARVTTAAGMLPLPVPTAQARQTTHSAETTLSRG